MFSLPLEKILVDAHGREPFQGASYSWVGPHTLLLKVEQHANQNSVIFILKRSVLVYLLLHLIELI